MICAVVTGPSEVDILTQINNCFDKIDLLELRVDLFTEINLNFLACLLERFKKPIIITLKTEVFDDNFQKLALKLASLKPAYLDLDCTACKTLIESLTKMHPQLKLIFSYHNFSQTPADMQALISSFPKVCGALYKVAVKANLTTDALNLLIWAQKSGLNNLIVVSMGYRGQFTRVIGPAHHSLITYTAIDTPKADLPEKQLSLHDLISIYKIKRLSASAKIYALIGNPIDLSVSQYTHNDFFAYNGKNSVYLKLQLEEFELKTFFQQLKELRVAGLSITMPFKEAVLPYLDCLSDEVLACGACNTVLVRDAKLYGFNTDGAGAVNALRKVIALTGKRVVILGAGGAAKAIAASLAKNGAQVAFVSRSFTRAQQTAKQIDVQAFKTVGEYDILINCTPVKDPLPANEILAKTVVFDINTANVNSPFLKAARQKGCLIIYGYELFLEQAKLQFKIWDR